MSKVINSRFLLKFKTTFFSFRAICIQEGWLCENSDISQIQLEGYKLIPPGKPCSSNSGLVIYLNEKYEYDVKM